MNQIPQKIVISVYRNLCRYKYSIKIENDKCIIFNKNGLRWVADINEKYIWSPQ